MYVNTNILSKMPHRFIKLVDGPIVLETDVYKFDHDKYQVVMLVPDTDAWIDNCEVEAEHKVVCDDPVLVSELWVWEEEEFCFSAIQYNIENVIRIKVFSKRIQEMLFKPRNQKYIRYIVGVDPELVKKYVAKYPGYIKFLTNPDPETRLLAIRENYSCFKYLDCPTDEEIKEVLERSPFEIKNIGEPLLDHQLLAVGKCANVIEYINNPHPDVVKLAMIVDGKYIKLLESPTEEDCETAIKSGGFKYVTNPTESMKNLAVSLNKENIRWISEPSVELQRMAVPLLKYIDNPCEAIVLECLVEDPSCIQWVDFPTEIQQAMAVNKDPNVIRFIKEPFESVQMIAVEFSSELIMHIKDPTDLVQLTAVESKPDLIAGIKNPSELVITAALKRDGTLIDVVDRVTPERYKVAVRQTWRVVEHVRVTRDMFMMAVENADSLEVFRHADYIN